ncbi:DNA-directed RNA polymerase subunit beta [Sesbania bispinosa]|nr:DNA-directed RNA polymerase subunit beta [Sesbania bispinosa]
MARCDGSVAVPYRIVGRSRNEAERVILARLRRYLDEFLYDDLDDAWMTLRNFRLRADVREVPVGVWQALAAAPQEVTPLQIEALAAFTAVNGRDPSMFGTILYLRAPLRHAYFCDLLTEWEVNPSRARSVVAHNLAVGYRTNIEGVAAWDLAGSDIENERPAWGVSAQQHILALYQFRYLPCADGCPFLEGVKQRSGP